MKPSLREDATSILAIASGAAISAALTAAFLVQSPAHHTSELHVVPAPPPHMHIYFAPLPPIRMSGPEGAHSGWFPEGANESLTKHEAGHRRPLERRPAREP